MYVAVKGGEQAIDNAHALLAHTRRGPADVADLTPAQIGTQLALAVDRVMAEGSLYDPELAALAIKQGARRHDSRRSSSSAPSARRCRASGASEPIDTAKMAISRRVSATFKDLPGGQVLGPTFDYTHRLIDFMLAAGIEPPAPRETPAEPGAPMPRVTDLLGDEGLIEREARRQPRRASQRPDPASRSIFPPIATFACRRWRGATRAFSCRSAIRRSAASAEPIPSSARSASAPLRWNSCRKSWASPSRSARSRSPSARW